MGEDSACVPWYLPSSDVDYPLCDPWAAATFRKKVSEITTECDDCLPDCAGTIYEASVSAVPFRNCDNRNLGVSKMCNLDETLEPPIFGSKVRPDGKF